MQADSETLTETAADVESSDVDAATVFGDGEKKLLMSAVPAIGFSFLLCDVFAGAAAIAGLAGVDDASLGCWSVCSLASAEMGTTITV